MKEISFSEFIAKNPHLVGFESPARMIPMAVHEILTNSLDACESAGILPEIWISLKSLDEKGRFKRYRLTVKDNGPGILPKKVPGVFGKLLFGSKFGVRKQSRGQQGIGVSAVVLMAQLKTGEHALVRTSTNRREAYVFELSVDVARNTATIHSERKEKAEGWKGVEISVTLLAQHSSRIKEYIELTAAINPHLTLHYEGIEDSLEAKRRTEEMPCQPQPTKPHPHGVDYEMLRGMLGQTKYNRLRDFLKGEFDRVRADTADAIIERSRGAFDVTASISTLGREEILALSEAISEAPALPPSAECLSPVGEETFIRGIASRLNPSFIEAVTRKPAAMRGQPFSVEVVIAYGCQEPLSDGEADPVTGVHIHRFVNRVPLLYSASGDVIVKAARDAGLNRYEVLPETRSHLLVHVAGVNIPYTSESKEAIKPVEEYEEEIRLAIQDCGRRISKRIRAIKRGEEEQARGKRKAVVHSLLLKELNRFAGKKVAGMEYPAAFGFEEALPELNEYGLDVFRADTKAVILS